jgi:N-acetylmuramoyl-L-alanine amidase
MKKRMWVVLVMTSVMMVIGTVMLNAETTVYGQHSSPNSANETSLQMSSEAEAYLERATENQEISRILSSSNPQFTPPTAPIVINPGHGWYSDTKSNEWKLQRPYFNGIVEDFINIELAIELNVLLVDSGFNTLSTRELDQNAPVHSSGYPMWQMGAREYLEDLSTLPEYIWNTGVTNYARDINARPRYANHLNAGMMINIHNNACGAIDRCFGTETLYDSSNRYVLESRLLATLVHRSLINRIHADWDSDWRDRGIKPSAGNYVENREFSGPAIILEIAFMTTQKENAALQQSEFRSLVTQAIHDGVTEYYQHIQQRKYEEVLFTYWPISNTAEGLIHTADPDILIYVGDIFLRQKITSDFGPRNSVGSPYHNGIDIPAAPDTPVAAVADGRLERVYVDPSGCDSTVIVYHPDLDVYSKYVHLNQFAYQISSKYLNSSISAGQVIGYTGPANICEEAYGANKHLHFSVTSVAGPTNEMRHYLNPLAYYPYLNSDVPRFSELSVRLLDGNTYVQATYPDISMGIQQTQPFWVSTEVRSNDKDIAGVSAWIAPARFENVQDVQLYGEHIYTFDYHSGTNRQNETMYFDHTVLEVGGANRFASGNPPTRAAYVYPGVTGVGQQSNDKFYVLVDPKYWIDNDTVHYLTFIAYDVVGNVTMSPYLPIRVVY